MKHLLLAAGLLLGLLSCKRQDAPAPTTATSPSVLQAYTPVAGVITLKPHGGIPYTASGLRLQITAESTANQTGIFYYTWRGLTRTGSGIEMEAKIYTKDGNTLGPGPWYAYVKTSMTDADFTNSKGVDYAGTGVLTATAAGYTLPFTAQFIDGELTQ